MESVSAPLNTALAKVIHRGGALPFDSCAPSFKCLYLALLENVRQAAKVQLRSARVL